MRFTSRFFRFTFRKALLLVLGAAAAAPALALLGLSWESGQLAVAGATLALGAILFCFAWASVRTILAGRFRFQLRTLLILTTLLAVLLATVGRRTLRVRRLASERAAALATLHELGASLYFDYQRDALPDDTLGWTQLGDWLLVPFWVRTPFVDSYFSLFCEVRVDNRPLSQDDVVRLRSAIEQLPYDPVRGIFLSIGNADLDDKELSVLGDAQAIRQLDLFGNKLTSAAVPVLANMPNLEWISLRSNPISVSSMEDLLRKRPELGTNDPRLQAWIKANR